jgi:hypothetical protein
MYVVVVSIIQAFDEGESVESVHGPFDNKADADAFSQSKKVVLDDFEESAEVFFLYKA